MELNHVNLTVTDVARSRDFFVNYFGFKCLVERGRNSLAVLTNESGFILTLMNLEKVAEVVYPGMFHIGFMQDSREKVDAIFDRLKAAGLEPQPPRDFHGAWTFYLEAPGGFVVEVGHQMGMA